MKLSVLVATIMAPALGMRRMLEGIRSNFGSNRFIVLPQSEVTDIVNGIFDQFDADQLGNQDGNLHLKVSQDLVNALIEEGVKFQDHTEEFITNMERNLNEPNFFCQDGVENCANKNQEDFHSTYQDYDAIHARFEKINSESSITRLETLGTSYEGRDVKLLWIGDDGAKPLIFYFCTMHAREWIVPMYCTFMAEQLTDGSAQSADLLSKFSFAIVPIANPDGYVYSFEVDNAWRKTTKPNPGSRCIGTDGNRNYATGWGGSGSSGRTCADNYRGQAPFDQPATANIKKFTDTYEDRIVHINDVHSYGEYFLSAYGGNTALPPDVAKHNEVHDAVFDAIQKSSGLRFTTGPAAVVLYPAAGSSIDYFYTENGVSHAYVYEARGGGRSGLAGFQPPTSNIMPSNMELYAGFIAAANVVYNQEVLKIAPPPFTGVNRNAPVEEQSLKTTNLQPLIGAVAFLGVLVALIGVVLVGLVKKMRKQPVEQTAGTNAGSKVPLSHYELQ